MRLFTHMFDFVGGEQNRHDDLAHPIDTILQNITDIDFILGQAIATLILKFPILADNEIQCYILFLSLVLGLQ